MDKQPSESVAPESSSVVPENTVTLDARRGNCSPPVVGERVAVYWVAEGQSFAGVVSGQHANGMWYVKYDDGDAGWVVMVNDHLEARMPPSDDAVSQQLWQCAHKGDIDGVRAWLKLGGSGMCMRADEALYVRRPDEPLSRLADLLVRDVRLQEPTYAIKLLACCRNRRAFDRMSRTRGQRQL
jgi:hypothetical protein